MPPDLRAAAVDVAPLVLGAELSSCSPGGTVTLRVTEVEAYEGEDDPASHAYRGRTPRNAVMFGPAGHLYTYLSYGIHWCANVVTGIDGRASAVLLRAGEVVEGHELARSRRGERTPDHRLARGPGCLGQALGLGQAHNGADLTENASHVRLRLAQPVPAAMVVSGPRVGVSRAQDHPWRFWIDGDPTVSAYRRSPRAQP